MALEKTKFLSFVFFSNSFNISESNCIPNSILSSIILVRILSQIIDGKIELGIQLDSLILDEFEKKTKDKNLVFSKAIDLIYESFNLDKKVQNKSFSKILKNIGKNKNLNNYFIKLADTGMNF